MLPRHSSPGMPLAYPPYSSRPAAQSASATIPPVSNTRPGTGSTVGMNDSPTAGAEPNKYLQEAREIEITLGDRQVRVLLLPSPSLPWERTC